MSTSPSHSPPTFPFGLLPPELRARILSFDLSTQPLWLHESTHTVRRKSGSTIKGSVQSYKYMHRHSQQREALAHWGLHTAGLSTVEQADATDRRRWFLSLRLVGRCFAADVDGLFFGRMLLWVKFDADFVAFLERVREAERYVVVTRGEPEQKQPVEEASLLAWVARFRKLGFVLETGCFQHLPKLSVLLEGAGWDERGEQMVPRVRIIVCGFTDWFFYDPENGMEDVGDGKLSSVFFQEGSCLKDVSEGEMRLWHGKESQWRMSDSYETVCYKIDWEARMETSEQRSWKVSGSWIQSTDAPFLRKALGEEYGRMADNASLDEDMARHRGRRTLCFGRPSTGT